MITGTHAIIYAEDAEKARAFFRDVLGFASIDVHDGWLIFKLPPAELAMHPAGGPDSPHGSHQLYLMCDHIESTVKELADKGVEFASPVTDQGWGFVTAIRVPGGGLVGLYEPKHATAFDLER